MNVLAGAHEQTELIEARGYAATLDGPVLVNSARESGPAGTAQVDAYIDAHAGYNYVEYRNRSLWVLLHAVLRHHPDQQWVQERLERILAAALMSGGAEFTAMAPLTAAALRQRLHAGDARPALAPFDEAVRRSIDALGHVRGSNDSWSIHRRALIALMELAALVARDAALMQRVRQDITVLEQSGVLDGYAGFRAPAELRLADALRATGVGGSALDERLDVALRTAHHIQDYRFCARITSRCNTLRRWHRTALDGPALAAAIERFAAAASSVEFAADHVVGEPYAYRNPDGQFVLPVWQATQANTLEALADVFQRPAVEFLRLNPGLTLTAPLAEGTSIRVPDPGLAPLLAVHLAARASMAAALTLPAKTALVRSLVSPAAENSTALDSVLGYLLLTSDPEDARVLDALVETLGPPALGDAPSPPAGPMTMPA
jgi:hypothetical protein